MLKLNRFYGCCETGETFPLEEKCDCGHSLEECGCGDDLHPAFEDVCACGNPLDECGCEDMDEMDLGGCGCGGSCGCSSDESADCGSGCSSGCGGGCGCGGGGGQMIRIAFEDGSEYDCPVLSIFEVAAQQYIALYHPEKQTALLYRFFEDENGISLESIEDEAEFSAAANTFQNN